MEVNKAVDIHILWELKSARFGKIMYQNDTFGIEKVYHFLYNRYTK